MKSFYLANFSLQILTVLRSVVQKIDSTIHWINNYLAHKVSTIKANYTICWIVIHPVDKTIHPLNNWGQMLVVKTSTICCAHPGQVIPSPNKGGREDHNTVNWPIWMSDQSKSYDMASHEKNG